MKKPQDMMKSCSAQVHTQIYEDFEIVDMDPGRNDTYGSLQDKSALCEERVIYVMRFAIETK